jgi:hypothetical protein
MAESESINLASAIGMRGHLRPARLSRDIRVPRRKFGAVAKVLFPDKAAAHLAAIGGADERTAKRWISGEYEPPTSVVIACVQEMLRRLD